MLPNNPQLDLGSDGDLKHLTSEGVSDVTPDKLFAKFTITSANSGKVLMHGSQINTPDARKHVEEQAKQHKVTWHD